MPPRRTGPKRFVGAHVPLPLFEAFEAARADRGIDSRSEAIEASMALWLDHNPPTSGVSKKIAELIKTLRVSRAVRDTFDAAVDEWRVMRSDDLARQIAGLVADVPELATSVPKDLEDVLKNLT